MYRSLSKNPIIETICVYSSSSSAVNPDYKKLAQNLGKLIAELGYKLVFGGCDVGLMGDLARNVKLNSGYVIGVLPESIQKVGIEFKQADESIITKNMRDRKAIMADRADAFIILPGGFGTLEEFFEILTLKQLGYENKPIIILNENHYFDKLFDFFEVIYQEHFAKRDFSKIYYVAGSIDVALKYLESYKKQKLPSKWFKK